WHCLCAPLEPRQHHHVQGSLHARFLTVFLPHFLTVFLPQSAHRCLRLAAHVLVISSVSARIKRLGADPCHKRVISKVKFPIFGWRFVSSFCVIACGLVF